jgi:hypothetical protein
MLPVFALAALVSASPCLAQAQPSARTPAPSGSAAPSAKTSEGLASISRITALVHDDSIVVRYSSTSKTRNLILYRGTAPFSDTRSLIGAAIVSVFRDIDGSFIDYPVPGLEYYYAIIDEELLKSGDLGFQAGANATANPVSIPAGAFRIGLPAVSPMSRSTPLPYLQFTTSVDSGLPLPESSVQDLKPRPVSPETRKSMDTITGGFESVRRTPPRPAILGAETKPGLLGEEYTLALIIDQSFRKGDWAACVDQIESFLSLHRTPETTARAHFYLGQAYLFTGQKEASFFEFLQVQDSYYADCQPWVEYLLTDLHD